MKRITFVIETPSIQSNKFDWVRFRELLIISKKHYENEQRKKS